VLGPREHESLLDTPRADQLGQQLALALAVDGMDNLADELDRRIPARDLDLGGVVKKPGGQVPDLVGERGREEQVLPSRRQDRQDPPDVADEAHVEHPIGLVEDEDLDRGEVDGALADVVKEASGRRHDDLRPEAQRPDLRFEADAAVDGGAPDGPTRAVGAHALLHLEREFAGRGQDEGTDRQTGGAPRAVVAGRCMTRRRTGGMEDVQHRQDERRGLAGARLSPGEEVAAGEYERDRGGLDRRGL
jgi:hypothetical protein